MAQDYDGEGEKRSRLWLWILLSLLIPFSGGIAAAVYSVTRYPSVAHWLHLVPATEEAAQVAQAKQVVVKPAPPPPPAKIVAGDAALADRLVEIQGKVDDIEEQARAATGDASRAEGLLVAFAARRALDRGSELGYIEALLRERFGQSQPQAVAMILSASRQPVTLPDLQNGLDAIAPTLATNGGGDGGQSWWAAFRQQLGGLIVVRRIGEPSSQPADRVVRAERMLEGGQVDGALAEILRLPDHDAAKNWIVMARRYLAGRGALDRIETAALLDPAVTSLPAPPVVQPAPSPPPAATGTPRPATPAPATATD
jgi:hypothetical protein